MKKFLGLLQKEGCNYNVKNETMIVENLLTNITLDSENIATPEYTDFIYGLNLENCYVIQLPKNLTVSCILKLRDTNVKRRPSNLTIVDDCSVYLDAPEIENVSYRCDCSAHSQTIFAFWANNYFLIFEKRR